MKDGGINMSYTIYMHKNKINHKVYIGQTGVELTRRFKGGSGYASSPHFYSAIQLYGWNNFEHLILEENLTAEAADIKEKYWIELFDATNPMFGYNLSQGGKSKPTGNPETNKYVSVICKETGRKFNSLAEAALWSGMKKESASNITAQIRGEKTSAGKHPETGEALHWCYKIEDIDKPNKKKQKPYAKKVKNLDTNEIFDSINEASQAYNITNVSISKSCKSQGQIAVGRNKKEKYHWCFLN